MEPANPETWMVNFQTSGLKGSVPEECTSSVRASELSETSFFEKVGQPW